MWYKDLFDKLELIGDKQESIKMALYMQNKFPFLGIPKPKLIDFIKPYLKESKKYDLDWNFIFMCWDKNYREAQYIAIEYIKANAKKLTDKDFDNMKKLIISKSWWETVDTLNSSLGLIVYNYPYLKETMLSWSTDKNIWLRRSAINFQQSYKGKTDTELLEKILVNNLGTNEFFINKAIGWSLRDYSKVNPDWVSSFINKYDKQLSNLTRKEASKYLIYVRK